MKLGLLRKQMAAMSKVQSVKVRIAVCGKVMIDGLPFGFSAASAGKASNKGIVVSFSGEPVENGTLKLSTIEMRYTRFGRAHSETKKLQRIEKKDGKHIYQVKFPSAVLEDGGASGSSDSEMFLSDVSAAYNFKLTPEYREEDEGEVMITVYPIEDPLGGLAVEWRSCTSDKEWFEHNPEAFKPVKKKKFF